MADPIAALTADRAALLGIGAQLTDTDWTAESGCPGWSVQDVVGHMAGLFWQVVDPSALPDLAGAGTEGGQEIVVASRRAMSPAENLADYEEVSEKALPVLASLLDLDMTLELGDLGTYPAHDLPLAFCFDHYLHIRADLLSPRGPLTADAPPADEPRASAALDWVEAALPQQGREALTALPGTVVVDVHGPGARTLRIGSGPEAGRLTMSADTLLQAITGRVDWAGEGVDVDAKASTMTALRALHLF